MNYNKRVYKDPEMFSTKHCTTNIVPKLHVVFLYITQNLSDFKVHTEMLYKTWMSSNMQGIVAAKQKVEAHLSCSSQSFCPEVNATDAHI